MHAHPGAHHVSAEVSTEAAADDDRRFRDLLRGYGLRSTGQRLAVFHLLARESRARHAGEDRVDVHLTPAQVHERLVEEGTNIDLATVYRTLSTLANLGALHTVIQAPNALAYGLAEEDHHHAVCTGCGTVVELPESALRRTLETARTVSGFLTSVSSVTVHGLCADCRDVEAQGE